MSTKRSADRANKPGRLNDLKVECFMLAGATHVVDGLFYVLGGGIDRVVFSDFPGSLDATALVRIVVPFTETNQTIQFEVRVVDEDGTNILPGDFKPSMAVGRPVHLQRGESQGVNFPLGFTNIQIPHPGPYTVELRHDDRIIATTGFTAAPLTLDQLLGRYG
jgi:hypothetical protein